MPKRLFIALELPEICCTELSALDPHVRGLRWLPAGQLHLTMSFLGDVDEAHEQRLLAGLPAVRVPPFFLPIQGVGTFGGAWPAVVWAGVGKGHPHLFALHRHLQDAVLRAGIEPDLRAFHPHITLARAKSVRIETLKPFLRKYAETEFGMWQVTGFVLCSSVVAAEGAVHVVELRVQW